MKVKDIDKLMEQLHNDKREAFSKHEVWLMLSEHNTKVPTVDVVPKGHWIPVSERLPGKNGCYLVSTTGTNNDIIDIAYYIEGMWHKASRIKAWMPLPEPYREDGE